MIEPIFEVDANVPYEWASIKFYRHPNEPEKFAASSGSGCSCDGWEDPTLDELRAEYPMSKTQARYRLKAFLESRGSYFRVGEVIRHLERFEVEMNEAAQ